MGGRTTETSISAGAGSIGRQPPAAYFVAEPSDGGWQVRRSRDGRRRLRDSRGQALVEMVILLPLFLLLVFGVIEFGRAFNYWIDLTHLANEGARYASVNKWPGCTGNDNSTGSCTTYPYLQDYLVPRGNTGEIRAELAESDGVEICFPEGSPIGIGDPVRVRVNAEVKLPVLNSLLDLLGVDDELNMTSSSTMRLEWTPDRTDDPIEGMVTPCP